MTDLPRLKLKSLVTFPASVLDGTGVDVVKENGTYQFNLAYDDFAPAMSGISDAINQTVLIWNSSTEAYTLVPVSEFGVGGAITEAPTDGQQYGREMSGWTVITPGSVVDGDYVDISVTDSGATWTIDNESVTYAKMQNASAASILVGRGAGSGAGGMQEITLGSNISMTGTILNVSSGTAVVGDGNYVDVTVAASGVTWTINNDAVTNAKLADMAEATVKGRAAASGTGDPVDLTSAQVSTILGLGTAALKNTGASGDAVPLLDQDNTWSGIQGYAETALTPTTPITWDVDTAPVATVALNTGATTMNAPTNVTAGRVYTIRFVNNATPGTVAWNAAFDFAGGTVPTITASASAVDRFTFIGRSSNVLEEVGRSQAIA